MRPVVPTRSTRPPAEQLGGGLSTASGTATARKSVEAPNGLSSAGRMVSPTRGHPFSEGGTRESSELLNAQLLDAIKDFVQQEVAGAFSRIEVDLRREVSDVKRHAELQDAAIVKLKTSLEELSGQVARNLAPPTSRQELNMQPVTDCLKATAEVGAQCLALNKRLEVSEDKLAEVAGATARQEMGLNELQQCSEVVLKMQSHKMAEIGSHMKELATQVGILQGAGAQQSVDDDLRSPLKGIKALATELLREHEAQHSSSFPMHSADNTCSTLNMSRESFGFKFGGSPGGSPVPKMAHFIQAPPTHRECGDGSTATPITTSSSGAGSRCG